MKKYMGDCMLQKYFTEDFLTGKKARNTDQREVKQCIGVLQELKRGREVCKESPTIEEGWRDKNIIHIENRTLV